MQRKFHGFPYISSALSIVPLILMNSCLLASQTHEFFCPTTLQFISLLDSSDTTSNIPYANPDPSNGTICWLVGAWPRFIGDLAQKIPVLQALSAIVYEEETKVSPEVVWEGGRTRFLHPGDVWWFQMVRGSTLRARHYANLPVARNLRCYLCATLLKGWTVLLPNSLVSRY